MKQIIQTFVMVLNFKQKKNKIMTNVFEKIAAQVEARKDANGYMKELFNNAQQGAKEEIEKMVADLNFDIELLKVKIEEAEAEHGVKKSDVMVALSHIKATKDNYQAEKERKISEVENTMIDIMAKQNTSTAPQALKKLVMNYLKLTAGTNIPELASYEKAIKLAEDEHKALVTNSEVERLQAQIKTKEELISKLQVTLSYFA